MNGVSDTNTIFDDSSISDSENSKSCEGTPFSNVQLNKAEMGGGLLKGKFLSNNIINLSKRNEMKMKFLFCQRALILYQLVIR